jgi:hypothetical protein
MPDPRGFNPCLAGEILECIDLGEYVALAPESKAYLDTILGCVYLDMRVGKQTRNLVYGIFSLSPITTAALNHLLDK